MAESICAIECAGEKMLVDDNSQNNGSIGNIDGDEILLQFDPRPQRARILNRRGFFLLNRDDEESNATSPGAENTCKQNNSNKPEVSHDRLKSPTYQQKIIKLTSKMSVSESQNCLKRRSTSNITSNGLNQESPTKKKHKPITWP